MLVGALQVSIQSLWSHTIAVHLLQDFLWGPRTLTQMKLVDTIAGKPSFSHLTYTYLVQDLWQGFGDADVVRDCNPSHLVTVYGLLLNQLLTTDHACATCTVACPASICFGLSQL